MIRSLFISLFFTLIIFSNYSFAQNNTTSVKLNLFDLHEDSVHDKTIEQSVEIVNRQVIHINEAIFQTHMINVGDNISLNLFSENYMAAEITDISKNVMGTTSIRGNIFSESSGHIIITHKDHRLIGQIHLYDHQKHFKIISDPQTSTYYLEELNEGKMAEVLCGGVLNAPID